METLTTTKQRTKNVITAQNKIDMLRILIKNPNTAPKVIVNKLNLSDSAVNNYKHRAKVKGYKYHLAILEGKKVKTKKTNAVLNNTTKSVFNNKFGAEKQTARQSMVNWIGKTKKRSGSILTLPCSDWFIEDMIQKQVSNKFSYVACERDENIFVKMVGNMHKYGRNNTAHQCEISEKLYSAKEDQYEHIIADYCGTLSKVKNELIHACNNNIVKKGGTLSVTIFKARNETNFIETLNNFNSNLSGREIRLNDNEEAIKMFFQSLASITEFEVVEELCYGDTSPMILVVLRRKK